MNSTGFLRELEELKDDRLRALVAAGTAAVAGGAASSADEAGSAAPASDPAGGSQVRLLQIALANEISVSELAAAWMPSTPEPDIKIALARQAGDEARHFQLVEERLKALCFDPAGFTPPASNPLFDYLRGLPGPVERVAGGLFTLESIAYGVNGSFMRLSEERGDLETHAKTPDLQARARAAVMKTIEIAAALRVGAAARLGTACLPGC